MLNQFENSTGKPPKKVDKEKRRRAISSSLPSTSRADPNSLSSSSSSAGSSSVTSSFSSSRLKSNPLSLSAGDLLFVPGYLSKTHVGIAMKPEFGPELIVQSLKGLSVQNEDANADINNKRFYLSSEAREKYHLTCKNGLFYDQEGHLISGPLLYVLFPNNELYGCRLGELSFHTSLSAGLVLKGAGVLYAEAGELITLSNESGHYKPTTEEMQPALEWFSTQMLNRDFIFEDHSHQDENKPFNGIEYSRVQRNHDGLKLEKIELEELVNNLAEIRNFVIERSCQREANKSSRKNQIVDGDLKAIARLDVYFSKEIMSPQTEITEQQGKDIFKYEELLAHTTLRRISLGYSSRFNGTRAVLK